MFQGYTYVFKYGSHWVWKVFNVGDNTYSLKFGVSNRGFPVVYVGKHKFIKHEAYKEKIRWTCNKRIQLGCKASLTTYDNVIVRSCLAHNHS
ncbi:unnamed protein product [Colias eurytheme]|nr:unnamed protein product [Colias eurytheme]